MPRYRAKVRGQAPDGVWHAAGSEFASDAKPGAWMELIVDPLDHDGDGRKGGARKRPATED